MLVVTVIFAAALSGCGGGGSRPTVDPTPPPMVQPPVQPPVQTPVDPDDGPDDGNGNGGNGDGSGDGNGDGNGGGNGGGRPQPPTVDPVQPTPLPQPPPVPQPVQPPVQPPVQQRDTLAAPGINRIPLSAIQLTNAQLAKQFAIAEYDASVQATHGKEVRAVACHSYITGCSNPNDLTTTPFSFYGVGIGGIVTSGSEGTTNTLVNSIASSVKLVSLSIAPMGSGPIEEEGSTLPFVVVHGAGNDGQENFFNTTNFNADNQVDVETKATIEAAAAAHKVLYVAGYFVENGQKARHPSSTGCTGMEAACLYAPFFFGSVPIGDDLVNVSGTSMSTPNVAAALASVLAVFPNTTGTELIRLAKTCAVSTSGLSGLGVADFGCMTKMGDDGQWRVVSSSEFSSLVTPSTMQQMRFPGSTQITASFGRPGGGQPIRLGLTAAGLYTQRYIPTGIPVSLTHKPTESLFLIVDSKPTLNSSIGVGYQVESGLFAAATYEQRSDFFGLGEAFGYTSVTAVNADFGHKNLFARISRQRSLGQWLITEAEGTSLGFTARRDLQFKKAVVHLEANADRFLGGTADTAFGNVVMRPSGWNREVRAAVEYAPNPLVALSFSGGNQWLGTRQNLIANANLAIRF